jgi:acyl carrier protein
MLEQKMERDDKSSRYGIFGCGEPLFSPQSPFHGLGQAPLNSGLRSDIRALDSGRGKWGIPGPRARDSHARTRNYLQYIKGLMMSSTFDQIANIIAETCDIPRDTIKPESHAIDDLGIDSLDFLDIAFAIDKAFGIKMPLEKWTQEVNDGKATTEQYFVLKNLADRIDELVAAKNAGTGTGS